MEYVLTFTIMLKKLVNVCIQQWQFDTIAAKKMKKKKKIEMRKKLSVISYYRIRNVGMYICVYI